MYLKKHCVRMWRTKRQRRSITRNCSPWDRACSLSKGDILSVIANFVECMRKNLYNGHSVNIRDFGVFSLSARTEGSETEKDCTAKKIRTVRINFRPSTGVRPDLASTRAEDAMEFVDLQTYLNGQKEEEDAGGSVPGGGEEQDPLG